MFISQGEVRQWFSSTTLNIVLGSPKYHADEIARWFLLRGGHRWRPFLCLGVYQTLENDLIPLPVWKCALAIECFHKASLIHDDIEDDDKPNALHKFTSMAIALNAGDLLIHHAYSLLANCHLQDAKVAQLLSLAAHTQKLLCFGQGEGLKDRNQSCLLKISPLFELALHAARICSSSTIPIVAFIEPLSKLLGDAYQCLDDVRDGTGSAFALRDKVIAFKAALAWCPLLHDFLTTYLDLMFGQSAAAAAASSADIAPTAASLAP